jgi:class 3 adenylate cyclase
MICPNCRHENRASARFCEGCGARLPRLCPACGAVLRLTARFCDACGATLETPPAPSAAPVGPAPNLEQQLARVETALPSAVRQQLLDLPEGETRIVTLLFADMTSSVAATAGLNPEDAAHLVNRLLTAMVDALMKYEGRVDRFLGDGVLAVFGAPQAHENDPERAIRAALEIREAARELGLNVTAGINTGLVYVGEVGSEQHQERTVMGSAVSLASRLQGQAEPGQILVGEATYRHTRLGVGAPVLGMARLTGLGRRNRCRGPAGTVRDGGGHAATDRSAHLRGEQAERDHRRDRRVRGRHGPDPDPRGDRHQYRRIFAGLSRPRLHRRLILKRWRGRSRPGDRRPPG